MTEHMSSNRVKVFSTFVQSGVISARMILGREQIEYFTQNEDVSAVYPIPGMGNVDFFVGERDYERARHALEPLIKGSDG
jgi:hypothetical protein